MLRTFLLFSWCWLTFTSASQSLDSLSGSWKCVDIRCKMMCEICCQYTYYDLQINDSIRLFHYPFQYYGASTLVPSDWRISNDTLLQGDDDVQFCYLRAKEPFDTTTIRELIRDTIHPNGLINKKWSLQTWKEDDIGEEGFDHTIHYPVTLPKKLFFTREKLHGKLKANRLLLLVNGKNQWCTIVSLTSFRLTLITQDQQGKPVEFNYLLTE